MKKIITIISLYVLALVSCTHPYETDFDFCLDRDECRFPADSGISYFRVFGVGKWTAEFETQQDWVSIDKTEGFGESQINITYKKNEGLSRGTNLFINHEDGTRKTIYMSQKRGLSKDVPVYTISTESISFLKVRKEMSITAVSNVAQEVVDSAAIKIIYSGEQSEWVEQVKVDTSSVYFSISENESGIDRSARIEIAFNGAAWDDPYTVFLNIVQTNVAPEVILEKNYELDPYGTNAATVKIRTNWDKELYTYDISDFSISDESLFTIIDYVDSTGVLTLLPQLNKGKNERSAELIWNVKDMDGNIVNTSIATLTQGLSAIQIDKEALSLTSGSKYANCYLLPEHEATYYSLEPMKISGEIFAQDIANAKILWQSKEYVIRLASYSQEEKLLYVFKEEGAKGNAVVALTTADGTIRWSLHFWATDGQIENCVIGGHAFMDRNLGAYTNTVPADGESDAAGLYYQWGRKDPFPTVSDLKTRNGIWSIVYPNNIMHKGAQDGVSLDESIKNPATYYWGTTNDTGNEDWSASQVDGYWSTIQKTDYDPCPYGYTVPDKTQMESLMNAISESTSYGSTIVCDNGETNYLCHGGRARRRISTSHFAFVGVQPHYWTTTSDALRENYRGSYALSSSSMMDVHPRRWGGNIRCVKTNNQ